MQTAVEHVYTPRGSALGLFACKAPEVLLSGPAGTGKSRACLEKLNLLALANPGMRGLILRKTATSLASTALVTWREHVIKEYLECGKVEYYGGSAQEAAQYRYFNGSVITVGGMDKSTRIMSSEYDIIYIQEAIELTENDWEACTTRLRNGKISFQQIIADTNPDVPTHWLKVRCDTGKTVMLESRHVENPRLYADDGELTEMGQNYITTLDNLTGTRYQRLRKGLWVASEGVIYEDYDPVVHCVDRFDIPEDWPRYWTVDFGMVHPFVLQWWAIDPDGRLFCYRELYHTGRTVDDLANQALSIVRPNGVWKEPRPVQIVTDHQAQERAILDRTLGMPSIPANKDVINGIQATQKRFKDKRLFLMRDSVVDRDASLVNAKKPTCTIEEIPGYVWDVGAGKVAKEAPRKLEDDGCDAMRYMVAQLDLGTEYRIRWI